MQGERLICYSSAVEPESEPGTGGKSEHSAATSELVLYPPIGVLSLLHWVGIYREVWLEHPTSDGL